MDSAKEKGCQTCARRKVKCDRTRPFCNNCTKGNRQCSGYNVLKFRDEVPRIRRRVERLKAREQSDLGPSEPVFGQGTAFENNWLIDNESADSTPGTFPSGVPLSPDATLFSPILDQNQLLHIFASSMDSIGDALPISQAYKHWFGYLHSIQGKHLLLDATIRAVSLAQLGFSNNIEAFVNESRPYYSKALLMLSNALQDANEGMSDNTLSVTVLLSYYEMFDQDVNWLRHADGVETLLTLRGPSAFRNGLGRDIYLSYRHILVGEAFYKNKPCFLDQPEWRELAEANKLSHNLSGVSPIVAEVLAAIEDVHLQLIRIPAFFADLARIGTLEGLLQESDILQERFENRAKSHRHDLSETFEMLSTTLLRVGYSTKSQSSPEPVLDNTFEFASMYIATMHTSFWSTIIALNNVLEVLDLDNVSIYRNESVRCGLNLVRSVSYFERSTFLGPLSVAYALPMALSVLDDLQQQAWIRRKLGQLGQRVKLAQRPWLL